MKADESQTTQLLERDANSRRILVLDDNLLSGELLSNSGLPPAWPTAGGNGDECEPDPATQTAISLAQLRKAARGEVAACLPGLRSDLHAFIKETNDEMRRKHLYLLHRTIRRCTREARLAGLARVHGLSATLEALIKRLCDTPGSIPASTIRTLAHATDLLARLVQHAAAPGAVWSHLVLVVDDEPVSRRAIVYSLETARLNCVSVGDPAVALQILSENRFDLIVVDILMPGISGHDLCRKLRALPGYTRVPVIFVTGLASFQSRVQSMLSGANDFVPKPFLSKELAVKAVVCILEWRLARVQEQGAGPRNAQSQMRPRPPARLDTVRLDPQPNCNHEPNPEHSRTDGHPGQDELSLATTGIGSANHQIA
ncbi:MAG: response regulator [Verrucomicrobiota bacterium]|nr:response regulator [Verrucomicrobiota bacterium]